MNPAEKKKAFISYPERELEYARRAQVAAAALGWDTFLAEQALGPGIEWREEIRKELYAADLFLAILTPAWRKSDWAIFELDLYQQACRAESKPIIVVPLEFEVVADADHMTPLFNVRQRVKHAADLTKEELCWVLVCAIDRKGWGERDDWDPKGRQLIGHPAQLDIRSVAARSLSMLERIELADELFVRYRTFPRLREVANTVLGVVPLDLSYEPRSACYQIVKFAEAAGLVERLRKVMDVD